jgi:hypothetical protein
MSDRAFVATRKGLFTLERSANGRAKWDIKDVAFLGDKCPMFLPDGGDGTFYAALSHGHFGSKLHRSTDEGKSWEECAVPTYPAMPEGAEPQVDPFGRTIPWKLQLIWSLERGGNPGELWCGTIPGGLFHSTDRGSSWDLVRTLWDHPLRRLWVGGGADYPGIHSICVHPKDTNHVTLGVSCGGVWETRDRGQTWACRATGMRAEYMPPDKQYEPNAQDPHRVVRSPTDPNRLYAQHHNGIFKTADGCDSWTEITGVQPSVFGFAVAVHPKDPDTAWFVPAQKDEKRIPVGGKVVVTRTRDGGKTFDTLTDGLPQQHAYDLVFRHAMDVDGSGERLVFGSTTGSVWVSEDAGDSWQTVSTHLPPVYAVRFG